jgi:hypothetical protein
MDVFYVAYFSSHTPNTIFDPLTVNCSNGQWQSKPSTSLFLSWIIAPLMNIQTMIQNKTDNHLIQKISAVAFGALSAIASVVLGLAEGCIRFVLDVTIGCVVTNNWFLNQTAFYNLALPFFVMDLAIQRMDSALAL